MKRLLIISYYWPPTGGSGVQRWVKFSKYLPEFGWQPVIYTPENPEQLARDESLLADVPECAEVVKTHISEPYDIYRRLTGARKQGAKAEINPLNAQKKSLKQKIGVWVRGNFFVPDPRIGWVRPSVKFLKEYLKEHPVDAMVTTGPPQSMHLIGLGLKKATGLKWIVDFRDPWTEMFYFKHLGLWPLAKWRHRRLEKKVLDNADEIISVTPLVQADFQKKTSTPVHLITNGFDEDDFACAAQPRTQTFDIVHTGLFASDGNPVNLWDVLAAKCEKDEGFRNRLRIRLAGKVDEPVVASISNSILADNLELLGYLPHRETVALQRSASVLMLPLRQEPEYRKVLPGKIFEYLAARRPVLGIGQSDGAAATVLRDTATGDMFDWDNLADVRAFIDTEWYRFIEGDTAPVGKDIAKYTRKALTAELVKIL